MGFLATIGDAIWDHLKPSIDELIEYAKTEIKRELSEQIPILVQAAVAAGVKAGSELAVDGVDKLTDLVPGDLDDQLIDPIVGKILGDFRKALGF